MIVPSIHLAAMTDEAERQGADPNDDNGIIRAIVIAHGFSFNAWLCVCMELADRQARREGFENQVHRAYTLAKSKLDRADADAYADRIAKLQLEASLMGEQYTGPSVE